MFDSDLGNHYYERINAKENGKLEIGATVLGCDIKSLSPRSRKRKSSEKRTKPDIFESHICIKT